MKPALFTLAVVIVIGAAIPLAGVMTLLVVAELALVAAPLALRAFRRRLDVFEPIVWANVALFVMFVVRPIAHWAYDSYSFRGYDLWQSLPAALAVAVVGTAAIQLGYAIPAGRAIGLRLPPAPSSFQRPGPALWFAVALVALGVVGYIAFPNPATAPSAYLYYLPMLLIPGALLLLVIGLQVRTAVVTLLAIVAIAGAFMVFGPGGQRAWLLVLLAPVVVYGVYLRRGVRPGVLTLLLLVPILLPFSAAARDAPTGGSLGELLDAAGRNAVAFPETMHDFVLGADTEMLDGLSLEVQVVPSQLGYHPGNSLLAIVAQPVPRVLWPDKPRQADDQVNVWFFGSVGYVAGGPGVAYSLFGGLFYDLGIVMVFLGGIVVGVPLRVVWEWYLRRDRSPVAGVVLAAMLPFVVILMRGNAHDTLARAFFVLVPILIGGWVSRRVIQPDVGVISSTRSRHPVRRPQSLASAVSPGREP
jgi:hypothetical protein